MYANSTAHERETVFEIYSSVTVQARLGVLL